MREFSRLEQRLLNEFQHGLPLTSEPYADIARQLGVYEITVLETLRRLQTEGVVSRVGAVFRPNRIGASTLAATRLGRITAPTRLTTPPVCRLRYVSSTVISQPLSGRSIAG